jgi:hypothetical protein
MSTMCAHGSSLLARAIYWFFFSSCSSVVVFCMKNCLSTNLRPSSIKLHQGFLVVSLTNKSDKGNLHDRRAEPQNRPPFGPVHGPNGEEGLQHRSIEEGAVQCHGEGDGIDKHHVLPQRQR